MSKGGRPTDRNQRYAERLVDAIRRGDAEGRDRVIAAAEEHGAKVKSRSGATGAAR